MSIDIATAIKLLPVVIKDPADTVRGMSFYKALGGKPISDELVAYIKTSEDGQRMLKERVDIFQIFTNREKLRSLPKNTLGNQYITWADEEGIYPEGLAEIADSLGLYDAEGGDPDLELLGRRQQVLHDMYHLLTGYNRDTGGEMALLTFSSIQEKNTAMRIIAWLGQVMFLVRFRFDLFKLRKEAKERAIKSPLLITQKWEELMERPINEVREKLGLNPMPVYKELW
jgi:ubiquinone biosynthesis protein COQ4